MSIAYLYVYVYDCPTSMYSKVCYKVQFAHKELHVYKISLKNFASPSFDIYIYMYAYICIYTNIHYFHCSQHFAVFKCRHCWCAHQFYCCCSVDFVDGNTLNAANRLTLCGHIHIFITKCFGLW